MPTLADIANEVNNKLSQIEAHTSDTSDTAALIKGDTADLKTRLDGTNSRLDGTNNRLDGIRGSLDAGFSFLGQGLFAILEAQREGNAHLDTQVDQNHVIICWLVKIADVLCRQLRTLEADLEVHRDVLATLQTLEAVLGLVHSREAIEVQREQELAAKIEQCCPPCEQPPQPCFEPCRAPKVVTHDAQGQDWDGRFDHGQSNPVG